MKDRMTGKAMKNQQTTGRKGLSAYHMALGGILLALCIAGVFMSSVVPGAEMTLLLVASCGIYVFCEETGIAGGFVLYAAACLLGFLLVPDKLAVIPLALVFGLYPLVKWGLEKVTDTAGGLLRGGVLPKRIGCLALKTVYYVAAFLTLYIGFKGLFLGEAGFSFLPSAADLPAAVLCIGGWAVFAAYDVILSECAYVFERRIGKKMRQGGAAEHRDTPREMPEFVLYHPEEKEQKNAEEETDKSTDR